MGCGVPQSHKLGFSQILSAAPLQERVCKRLIRELGGVLASEPLRLDWIGVVHLVSIGQLDALGSTGSLSVSYPAHPQLHAGASQLDPRLGLRSNGLRGLAYGAWPPPRWISGGLRGPGRVRSWL